MQTFHIRSTSLQDEKQITLHDDQGEKFDRMKRKIFHFHPSKRLLRKSISVRQTAQLFAYFQILINHSSSFLSRIINNGKTWKWEFSSFMNFWTTANKIHPQAIKRSWKGTNSHSRREEDKKICSSCFGKVYLLVAESFTENLEDDSVFRLKSQSQRSQINYFCISGAQQKRSFIDIFYEYGVERDLSLGVDPSWVSLC